MRSQFYVRNDTYAIIKNSFMNVYCSPDVKLQMFVFRESELSLYSLYKINGILQTFINQ